MRASISSWSSILSSLTIRPSLLHHEAGEVDLLDVVCLAARGFNDVTDGRKRIGPELFFTGARGHDVVFLIREQHEQIVSDDGIVRLQHLDSCRVARHHLY